MNDSMSKESKFLVEMLAQARAEVSDVLSRLDGKNAEASLISCLDIVNGIGAAANDAGFTDLAMIAEMMQSLFGAETGELTPALGEDLVAWLDDARAHLDAPEDRDLLQRLLHPIPESVRADVAEALVNSHSENRPAGTSRDDAGSSPEMAGVAGETVADSFHFSPDGHSPAVAEATHASDEEVAFIFDDGCSSAGETDPLENSDSESADAAANAAFASTDAGSPEWDAEEADEPDEDSLLDMLAFELLDVSPRLKELADQIVAADPEARDAAIGAYQEIVSRVREVASGLGLQGLVFVTDFVGKNSNLAGQTDESGREESLEVLQGWPEVVAAHLKRPDDDAICLELIDYLERDNWPEPLAYREVRELIDGLTSGLAMSGDYEAEARETEASDEDVALQMSEDASPRLVEAFFAESPGHAEALSSLVEAISNGLDIQENVEAAQRIAHTLKGSGNLVGCQGIANLAHHLEDIFEYIAKRKLAPPEALAQTMQEAADTLEIMLESLQGLASPPEDARRVLQDVLDWANRMDSGEIRQSDIPATDPAGADEVSSVAPEPAGEAATVALNRRASDTPARRESDLPRRAGDIDQMQLDAVRVPKAVLDNVVGVIGENAIAIGQIQENLRRLEETCKQIKGNDVVLQKRRLELEKLVNIRGMAARHRGRMGEGPDSDFDPLEMDEYDEFYGATHAYIEGVADSRELLQSFSNEVADLKNLFLLQSRLNKELQQVAMSTRMVPVNSIASRLQRTVRQACRATGRQAELQLLGGELLIDAEVLSKLTDALMHMLRNSIDHSVETREDRESAGKPGAATVSLTFSQEGNNIVVDCADDGRGLDFERIREIGVKSGLISEDEAMDERLLAGLILKPGFSTKDKVTQVSGRGVGMDVVNNTITKLSGSMDIGQSEQGGARIVLRVPVTLLVNHCLLVVAADNNVYGIPTSVLEQILSPGIGEIRNDGEKRVYQLEQETYDIHSLNSLLGFADHEAGDAGDKAVLLLRSAEGTKAILVDVVKDSTDLVVKNMGAYVKDVRGVAGVSTLGDGRVVVVLDMISLIQAKMSDSGDDQLRRIDSPMAPEVHEVALPKIMVVDDSLSARNSLSQLMADGGYRVVIARDGIEAIEVMNEEQPDVVLTDLEMPRMNGLELLAYMRNSDRWNSVPVVMITSRTMVKHRQQAEKIGVNEYITKPYNEDDVLTSIQDQLMQKSA